MYPRASKYEPGMVYVLATYNDVWTVFTPLGDFSARRKVLKLSTGNETRIDALDQYTGRILATAPTITQLKFRLAEALTSTAEAA